MSDLISRETAKANGLRFYFTGKPCNKNHVTKRFVDKYSCYQCHIDFKARKRLELGATPRPKTEEERKLRRRAALQKYAENNKEKVLQSQIRYKTNNKDKLVETKRKWANKQPKEYYRLKSHKRRALVVGKVSKNIKDILYRLQKGRCGVCRVTLFKKFEIDHIIPLIKGGEHADRNLQLLCPPCNRYKAAKDPVDFMQERGYLL